MLELIGVSKSFVNNGRTLTVLSDVTSAVSAGETVAIVGPSGSGKTTLLGIAAGLDEPTTGTVRLCDVDLATLDEDGRARLRNEQVGFVFQSFRLIPTLTAIENVTVPAELRRDRDASERARRLLEKVGLAERVEHYPAQLSGGEQQRVALARAFINEPTILFADEPTGNLDVETGASIKGLLFDLNRERGTTLILVTHDMELASMADRIVFLRGGRVVEPEERPEPIATVR